MKNIINLSRKMYPHFYIFDESAGKFFYKRVDNFDKSASIQKFILKQYGKSKDYIINKI